MSMTNYEQTLSKVNNREGAKERYAKFLERCEEKGIDPKDQESSFCSECNNFPAYKPRVLVANLKAGTTDKYHLNVPPLCDMCCFERGLTRYSFLVPKTEEFQGPTEMMKAHLERIKPWVVRVQEKAVQDLMEQGMSEEDAKGMLGVQ